MIVSSLSRNPSITSGPWFVIARSETTKQSPKLEIILILRSYVEMGLHWLRSSESLYG
jgi:hypothetical protein